MRRIDVIVVLLLLLGIGVVAVQDRGESFHRRPQVADRAPGFPRDEPGNLPAPSAQDPEVTIPFAPKRANVSGSAFSVAPGVWLTADHVTESCRTVYIQTHGGLIETHTVVTHGDADVAVIRTRRSGPALALSDRLDLQQDGFHVGFPAGEPGDVASSLIGRLRVRATGAARRVEPAVAWAEALRIPANMPTLGGISGGPVFDANGRAVGVNIGGSQRRGTVVTAAPTSMRQVLERAQVAAIPDDRTSRPAPSRQSLSAFGNALRRDLSVAKVLCVAGPAPRRPLAPRR